MFLVDGIESISTIKNMIQTLLLQDFLKFFCPDSGHFWPFTLFLHLGRRLFLFNIDQTIWILKNNKSLTISRFWVPKMFLIDGIESIFTIKNMILARIFESFWLGFRPLLAVHAIPPPR